MNLEWNGGATIGEGENAVCLDGIIELLLGFLSALFDKYFPAEIK